MRIRGHGSPLRSVSCAVAFFAKHNRSDGLAVIIEPSNSVQRDGFHFSRLHRHSKTPVIYMGGTVFEARSADGMPIDIDQFRQLENADRLALYCMGCNAEVFAVAWKPNMQYKRASHFRLRLGHKHEAGCLTEAYEKFVDSGKKRTVQSASDIPGGYPSRLVFRKQEALIDTTNSPDVPAKDRFIYGSGRLPDNSSSTRNGNTTSSLLQVCRFYINCPQFRDLPFQADGIEGAKFREAFKSLHFFATERVLPRRIHFGSLLFKVSPEISPDFLLVTLVPRIKGGNERCYRLEICWKDWSAIRRNNFLKQIEEKRAFLREQWIREKQSSSSQRSCLYVFFIGDQAEDDLALFRVRDPRNVCILPSSYETA